MIAAVRSPIPWNQGQVEVGATIGIAFGDAGRQGPETSSACGRRRDVSGQARGPRDVPLLSGRNGRRPEGARRDWKPNCGLGDRARRDRALYQPIVALPAEISSASRCSRAGIIPTNGLIAPDDFIPVAEETGMIADLFYGLLRQACLDARNWPPHLQLAVNISPQQLAGSLLPAAHPRRAARDRIRAEPARGRDHGNRAHQRPRSGANHAHRRCRASGSGSRSTISGPAIPASTTCANCNSTSSRSIAAM